MVKKTLYLYIIPELQGMYLKRNVMGLGMCHENLKGREEFHPVWSYDDSLSEYALLNDLQFRLF